MLSLCDPHRHNPLSGIQFADLFFTWLPLTNSLGLPPLKYPWIRCNMFRNYFKNSSFNYMICRVANIFRKIGFESRKQDLLLQSSQHNYIESKFELVNA